MKKKKALILLAMIMTTALPFTAFCDETEEDLIIIQNEEEAGFTNTNRQDEITVTGEPEETEGLIVDPEYLYDGYDETADAANENLSSQDPQTLEMNPDIAEETVVSEGCDHIPADIDKRNDTYQPSWLEESKNLLSAASDDVDASSFFGSQLNGPAYTLYSHRVQYYAVDRNTAFYTDTEMGDASSGYLFSYTGKYKIVDGYLEYDISQEESAQAYTQCVDNLKYAMQATQDAFELDHPEVFWHRSGRTWKYKWNFDRDTLDQQNQTCTFYIYSVTYTPVETYLGAISSMAAFDNAVQNAKQVIEQMAQSSEEDEEWSVKYARQANIYLAQKLSYGSEYIQPALQAEEEEKASGSQSVNNVFSIYNPAGAFLDDAGTGSKLICEGYAKAFKILCDEEGIPCILICGAAGNTGHMWNAVETNDGTWYFTDPTWSDSGSTVTPKYFMVTKNQPGRTMSGKRTTSQYSPAFVYPALSEQCYRTCHQNQETSSTQGTCTQDGERTLLCEWCGAQQTVKTPAPGHDYIQIEEKAATCEERGFIINKCSRCGDTVNKTIPAKGHNYKETNRQAASCTQDGSITMTCSNCNAEKKEALPKTGHAYKITSNTAPTCVSEGKTTYKCERCADSYSKTNPSAGHLYNQEQTVPPTCIKSGYTRYTCTKCGAHYDDKITSPTGHTFQKTHVAPATETTGAVETDTCTKCGFRITKIISNPLSEAEIIKNSGLAKAVTLKKLKKSGKKIKVTWSYAKKYKKKATSFAIQISSNKQFKEYRTTIIGKKKTSAKIAVSTPGTYYVRIRALNENGHSAWSKTKKIKLK